MPFTSGENNFLQLNQDGFDFNIQFEQLFFSIIPSVLFILTSLWRSLYQARKPSVVNGSVLQLVKLGAITSYSGLELALLILAAVGSFQVTAMFLASSVLKLVAALFMVTLSLLDHSKSPRPSVLLSSYLFLTLILDVAQARTLFLASDQKPELSYSVIFAAAMAFKVVILLLEARRKSQLVDWNEAEHSPEETSSIFSLGVFFWLNNIFLTGYKKVLTLKDLYPLDTALAGKNLHEKFSQNLDYSKLKGDKFGLVKVLARTLVMPLLLPVLPRIALLCFEFCQPFFIESLLHHLAPPGITDANVGYGFIGASILIYSGRAISTALYWYFQRRMLAMARTVLVTETFVRATKARIGASEDSAAVTLMSTDIERINVGFTGFHDIWASVIQVAVSAWMLYNQLGAAFVAPMIVVICCFIGLVVLMSFTGDSQRSWMAGVQKRVGLTATVISNMKNLKISGLASAIGDFVHDLRIKELQAGSRFRKIAIIAAVFGFTPLLISPPLTFAFAQRTLNTSRIFTSLSYLLLLTSPLSIIFQTIPQLLSGLACLGRIQAFLECETREDFRKILAEMKQKEEEAAAKDSTHVITIENGEFAWEEGKPVLQNINTAISESDLNMVVGPVGSGKSTFCKALLGEMPFTKGKVTMRTRFPHVGFCDQTAFLHNGTIKHNIIGFSEFDEERYNEIINATALVTDFNALAKGDLTNVGSNGITLSGGQKQRVSLARALYLRTDLLVLDDIFSGLDADTEEQVFRQVFGPGGLLRRRGSTVVLCTHSVVHLPAANHIIALGGGSIVEQGAFDILMARPGYVQRLGLKTSSNSDSSERRSTEMTRPTAVQQLQKVATNASTIIPEGDMSRQMGDKTVYKHYFKSMGFLLASSAFLFAALWGFFTNFPTIWLKYWSDDISSSQPVHSFAYYVGIYTLLQMCAMASLLLLGIVIFLVSVRRAGANIHLEALGTLVHAPLRFFTTTDTGVVTNLFSQDLNLIDTELPNALLNLCFSVFQAIGQAAVMLTASPLIGISYPFLGLLLYVIQKFYLRTSRQLRLLDLEAKSPLYTHFLDTLKGISTLRAFGFIPKDIQKNLNLVDSSQRPAYLLAMIQEWLNLVLGLVVMIIATVLTTLAVRLRSNAGFTGASLVTLMSFGENLSGIVVFYTRLETSIGAIARIKTFNETVKPEDRAEEDIVPPEEWPEMGVIELKGVSASYDEPEESNTSPHLALHDIELTIASGEKVAICGRTGSGKSSLIALFLKLLDPLTDTANDILIDNTPLRRINRSALRRRIIAVPQEAVFLPDGSTFQANLDPFGIATFEECQAVVVAVGLGDFVEERGGLEAEMNAGSLSAGQRQLMSLGRALLRRRIRARTLGGAVGSRGILLLDEVSSSVDHETERLMQEIIRAEFRDYTVVAVSHRLDMIMDFDRVVVMDTGKIVEIGNPLKLASDSASRFGELSNNV